MHSEQFREFVREVRRRCTGVESNIEAIEAIRATLATLSECLPGATANELVGHLPMPGMLTSDLRQMEWAPGEQLSLPEFVLRVGQREGGIPGPAAREHARTVLDLLRRSVDSKTFDRVLAGLPAGFESLFGADPTRVHMHQPIS